MSRRRITHSELLFCIEHGYFIASAWIGPVEGWEYHVRRPGAEEDLCYRKSERAAYNWIKRQVDKAKSNA